MEGLYKKGSITDAKRFKRYLRQSGHTGFDGVPGVLQRLGYQYTRSNLCRSCHKLAKTGCCDGYSYYNRYRKMIILNMQLK